jgi:hypothetical protein
MLIMNHEFIKELKSKLCPDEKALRQKIGQGCGRMVS